MVAIEENSALLPHRVDRPQGTNLWILEITLEGNGLLEIPSGEIFSTPGHAFLFPANWPQRYGWQVSKDPWKHFWAAFQPRPHWEDYLKWPGLDKGVGSLSLTDRLYVDVQTSIEQAMAWVDSPLAMRWDMIMLEIEKILLWCESLHSGNVKGPLDPRIEQACEWIGSKLTKSFSLAELSRAVGLSESRLSHLFKVQMGITPLHYQSERRLEKARTLLQMTSRPISEISELLGYSSSYYFSRRFRKSYGVAPREFRKRNFFKSY